ncbi:hypothetical protein FXB41_13705 [Bradyrhizobium canariense]|uniref:hypothetical protein n=1 Tax=Bradyrhizobium canariense TaxID=255045 RepID=UPI001CA55E2C|nr:hypothetical protein [Bradyrhizobium canariense]MBW5435800.1 hypothetical protein [Bradyrhizobium canariense]
MPSTVEEIEAEHKNVQLEVAKLDPESKRLDLADRTRPAIAVLSNPVVISGVIAALVTPNSGTISYIVSSHQKQLETRKAENAQQQARHQAEADARLEALKTESTLILEVRTYDSDQAATHLKFLTDVGLIPARRLAQALPRRTPAT